MTSSRRIGGAKAKAQGDAFEEWLTGCILDPLVQHGHLGRYDHLQPEMVSVYATGQKRRLFTPTAESGGDWILLLPGAIYCAAEAKSIQADRFPRKNLAHHQEKHLDTAVAFGAPALLLLRFNWPGAAPSYWVPWQRVPWQVLRTAESVHFSALERWAVRNWTHAMEILAEQIRSLAPDARA